MVWVSISYRQRTQEHFKDGNLNVQRYCDEILRPIVLQFIHSHSPMLQYDNLYPYVAKICVQFLKAENFPVLTGLHSYQTCYLLSTSGMIWIDEQVPKYQSTKGDVSNCMRQIVVIPDTDRFSFTPLKMHYVKL